jgi:L-ascorbate metabolism protein UlaG (beta-lactamase superfamily)
MRVKWYGQAAFHLSGRDGTVFIDPIGEVVAIASEHDEAAGTQEVPTRSCCRLAPARQSGPSRRPRSWIA